MIEDQGAFLVSDWRRVAIGLKSPSSSASWSLGRNGNLALPIALLQGQQEMLQQHLAHSPGQLLDAPAGQHLLDEALDLVVRKVQSEHQLWALPGTITALAMCDGGLANRPT